MELSVVHELIGKELAGELSTEEREVLTAWLAQAAPEEKMAYEATKQYWYTPPLPIATAADTAAATAALLARLPEPQPAATGVVLAMTPPARMPWWRSRIAAAVAGLLLAGSGVYYGIYPHMRNEAGAPLSYQEHTTPRGATAKVVLADGTAVWLNADSHLWYPRKFTGRQREIYLQGEAFFDVKPNRQQPFVVHANQQQVRVLGTSFNVQAYPDEPTVETAVVTGRVAFIRQAQAGQPTRQDTLYVTPNQRAVFARQTASMHREIVNSADYTAWSRGQLVFQQTPLDEVARTLARQYNVPVLLDNDALRSCRLTGRFHDQSLREVVSLLSMTGSFGFELTTEQLRLTGAGCR